MDVLARAAALGIVAAVLGLLLKKHNPELALLLALAAAAAILAAAAGMLGAIRDFLEELASFAGISPALLAPVVKSVGIAITGRLGADVCKDAGQSAAAAAVEIAAAASAICVSIPLMRTVLDMLQSFL